MHEKGVQRMFLHNRTGIVALAAAAFVMTFAGFGCDRGSADGPGPSTGVQDAGDAGAVTWSAHRSEALGIVLPYPEGWTVIEHDDRSLDVFDQAPPGESDVPSQLWSVVRDATSVEGVIQSEFPVVLERADVTRDGRTMTRIVYPYDARLRPNDRMVAYAWLERNGVHITGGQEGSAVLEYAVDHLEVLP